MARRTIEPDDHKLHMVSRLWSVMLNHVVVKDSFMGKEGRGGVKCKIACHASVSHQHETPMWLIWTWSAPLNKLRDQEMYFKSLWTLSVTPL